MSKRSQLAMDAMLHALAVREKYGYELTDAICPYDMAKNMEVEVKFMDISSMEGIYCKNEKLILVSSRRPSGRKAFTCAHEIGHHIFGHGDKIDDQIQNQLSNSGKFNRDEYLADCFAGFLLMPKIAVSNAFFKRGWDEKSPHVSQVFSVAKWFGVGYETMINHMQYSLHMIDDSYAARLLKHNPKSIRSKLYINAVDTDITPVDKYWSNRAIDLQVGEYVLLTADVACEGENLKLVEQDNDKTVYVGKAPGIGRLYDLKSDWSSFVRVSKQDFIGRSIWRHEEDPDYV